MTGDPVNISNIEKKIKGGIDSVSENMKNVDFKKHGNRLKKGFDHVSDNISETVRGVDFQKQGNRLKSSSQTFFDTLGTIIMFFLKVIAKFIGIILIIIGISALIALIIALFTMGITNAVHFPGMDLLDVANAANIPIWLMSLFLFFAFAIPFFFVFYLGLKILVNNLKSIGKVAKFTLLGLWVVAIIGLIITGVKQATEHAFDAAVTSKEELFYKANDTLNLATVGYNDSNNYFNRSTNDFKIIEDENGRRILSSNVRIIVNSTKDSIASISIEKEAAGSSYSLAKTRAENIEYDYQFSNNKLQLNNYHFTDAKNKYSEQKVKIVITLPEGTVLYSDKNVRRYLRYSSGRDNIMYDTKDEQYLKIMKDDVKCLDCEEVFKGKQSQENHPT